MSRLEKIVIALCLACAVAMNLMGIMDIGPRWLNAVAAYLTIGILFGLAIYYLIKTKFSIYSLIFVLLALWPIGGFLVLLYWQGYGYFATAEVLAYPIIALLLFRTAWFRYLDHKEVRVFYILIGLVLIAQFFVGAFPPYKAQEPFSQTLDYIMLAALLGMWLYRKVISIPENRMMTLIGIQAALFVISDFLEYLARNQILSN